MFSADLAVSIRCSAWHRVQVAPERLPCVSRWTDPRRVSLQLPRPLYSTTQLKVEQSAAVGDVAVICCLATIIPLINSKLEPKDQTQFGVSQRLFQVFRTTTTIFIGFKMFPLTHALIKITVIFVCGDEKVTNASLLSPSYSVFEIYHFDLRKLWTCSDPRAQTQKFMEL